MKTKEEWIAERDKWLNKAVDLKGQGKSDTMVNMALNKAHDAEKLAFPAPYI